MKQTVGVLVKAQWWGFVIIPSERTEAPHLEKQMQLSLFVA